MKGSRFQLLILVLICAFFPVSCATYKDFLKNSDYRQILDLQRQKAQADPAEEEPNQKITTAAGFERIGDNHLRQGNLVMAFIQYRKGLALEPLNVRLHHKMGRLFLNNGLLDDALASFRKIAEINPSDPLAYEGEGRVLMAKGEPEKAIAALNQAVGLNPRSANAYELLGIIYSRQGRYDLAVSRYQAAVAINPRSESLFNNMGVAYYRRGDYEKATDSFYRASRVGSDYREIVYNNLALSLCKLKRYQDAYDCFKQAGDEWTAHNNLGYIFMLEKKYDQALEHFEKAFAAKPSFYLKARQNMERAKTAMQAANSHESRRFPMPSE